MRRTVLQCAAIGVVVILLLGAVAGCADDEDGADEDGLRPITATPTAVVGLPEDIEEMQLIVEDGEFDSDSLSVIAEEPVILTIVNRDDVVYTFAVGDVITETEIPAAAESTIEFNIPTTEEYEGQLLGPDGEEVDTIFFEVTGPGGL